MVADDTLKARVVRELYLEAAYLPRQAATDDVAMVIAPPAEQGSAHSAIERTMLASLAPVDYVDGTGRSAIAFERGQRDQINARAKDWIERHDPDELPSGLK
jgi:hypothetical protein